MRLAGELRFAGRLAVVRDAGGVCLRAVGYAATGTPNPFPAESGTG